MSACNPGIGAPLANILVGACSGEQGAGSPTLPMWAVVEGELELSVALAGGHSNKLYACSTAGWNAYNDANELIRKVCYHEHYITFWANSAAVRPAVSSAYMSAPASTSCCTTIPWPDPAGVYQ